MGVIATQMYQICHQTTVYWLSLTDFGHYRAEQMIFWGGGEMNSKAVNS